MKEAESGLGYLITALIPCKCACPRCPRFPIPNLVSRFDAITLTTVLFYPKLRDNLQACILGQVQTKKSPTEQFLPFPYRWRIMKQPPFMQDALVYKLNAYAEPGTDTC